MANDPDKDELRRRLKGDGHVRVEHLEAHAKQLRDELAALHADDKAEREELRVKLDGVMAHIEEQKKAAASEDEVKGSKTTLVVPPGDIPPAQPNVGTTPAPEKKEHWLKRAW